MSESVLELRDRVQTFCDQFNTLEEWLEYVESAKTLGYVVDDPEKRVTIHLGDSPVVFWWDGECVRGMIEFYIAPPAEPIPGVREE